MSPNPEAMKKVLVNFHVASWNENFRNLTICAGNVCLRFKAPFVEVSVFNPYLNLNHSNDGDSNLQIKRMMPFLFSASDLKLADEFLDSYVFNLRKCLLRFLPNSYF